MTTVDATTTAQTLEELAAQLPEGAVITDPVKMEAYRWDRANDPDAGTHEDPLR